MSDARVIKVTGANFPDKYKYGVRTITTNLCEYMGESIHAYTEQDEHGAPHGLHMIDSEYGLYKYCGVYKRGQLHNRTGPARIIYNRDGTQENRYFINGAECPRGQLGKKQQTEIKNLLPQPIAEEVLENYSID